MTRNVIIGAVIVIMIAGIATILGVVFTPEEKPVAQVVEPVELSGSTSDQSSTTTDPSDQSNPNTNPNTNPDINPDPVNPDPQPADPDPVTPDPGPVDPNPPQPNPNPGPNVPTCTQFEFLDTNTNTCSSICPNSWEIVVNSKCTFVCSFSSDKPYWDKSQSLCISCDKSWQTVSEGQFCVDKCTNGLYYSAETQDCDACTDFWKVINDKTCGRKCPINQSVNRYTDSSSFFRGQVDLCVDIYSAYDQIASTSDLLDRNSWRIYGSFSNQLNINCNGNAVYDTVYSSKLVDLQDYQYVEYSTKTTATENAYKLKISMFVPTEDWRRLDALMDTADSEVMQCSETQPETCFENLMATISDAYMVHQKLSNTNIEMSIEEGPYKNGKFYGLHRENDSVASNVGWYDNDLENGKQIFIRSSSNCIKRVFTDDVRGPTWDGTDLTTAY